MAQSGRPKKADSKIEELAFKIGEGNNEEVKIFLQENGLDVTDGAARSALHWTIVKENRILANWLLEKGANVNCQDKIGYSPLHFAALEKKKYFARLLISYGANLELRDRYGNTALWTAVMNAKGDYEVVKILISKGANLDNINNAGKTPRQMAETMFSTDFSRLKEELGCI